MTSTAFTCAAMPSTVCHSWGRVLLTSSRRFGTSFSSIRNTSASTAKICRRFGIGNGDCKHPAPRNPGRDEQRVKNFECVPFVLILLAVRPGDSSDAEPPPHLPPPMKILVIDVGGTHVKAISTGRKKPLAIASGPHLSAKKMVAAVRQATADWKYDAVSIGYPGPVIHGHPVSE